MARLALLALLLAAAPLGAEEQIPLKPALSARASFDRLDGESGPIPPNAPFGIAVEITNHAASEPPKGLSLYGWLRRAEPSNLPCAEAAESFMRTGRLPVGAVFLNDPLISVVTEDDAFLLVDPDFSLMTANIFVADSLPSRPTALVVDSEARRLLLPMPGTGQLLAADLSGRIEVLAEGLDRPVAAVAGPALSAFVLEAGTGRLRQIPDGPSPTMRSAGMAAAAFAPTAALWGAAGALAFDTRDGGTLLEVPGRADVAVILASIDTPFGLAVARDRTLSVHYFDAPDAAPVEIPLAAPVTTITASEDGRILFAHDPEGGPVSVIDVGRGRLVQATSAGAGAVSEVIVSDRAAYLMMADQSRVGVLDFVSLARGVPSEFREVPLGQARETPLSGPGLMTRLWPDSGVLAVHAASGQGYRIEDFSAMGNSPAMTATPIRGGVPRLVAQIDRSFTEIRPGTFSTVASLPGAGRWELVLTTGLGALSFCLQVPVADPGTPAPVSGRLLPLDGAGDRALRLRLVDGTGAPLRIDGHVTFAAMSGAWRDRIALHTGSDGISTAIYDLPPRDTVVVTFASPDGRPFHPLVLEARP